jgi:hypothetical protein
MDSNILLNALIQIAKFDDSEHEQDRILAFRWRAVDIARAAIKESNKSKG